MGTLTLSSAEPVLAAATLMEGTGSGAGSGGGSGSGSDEVDEGDGDSGVGGAGAAASDARMRASAAAAQLPVAKEEPSPLPPSAGAASGTESTALTTEASKMAPTPRNKLSPEQLLLNAVALATTPEALAYTAREAFRFPHISERKAARVSTVAPVQGGFEVPDPFRVPQPEPVACPHPALSRDVLAFLPFLDLLQVAGANKAARAYLESSQPSLELAMPSRPSLLRGLCTSSLRRHVTTVVLESFATLSELMSSPCADKVDLAMLSAKCPHLQSLGLLLPWSPLEADKVVKKAWRELVPGSSLFSSSRGPKKGDPLPEPSWTFPPVLKELCIDYRSAAEDELLRPELFLDVSRVQTLTSLRVRYVGSAAGMSLPKGCASALMALPMLRSLELPPPADEWAFVDCANAYRNMRCLTSLDAFGFWTSPEQLGRLTGQQHIMRLRSLNIEALKVDDSLGSALAQVPTLTSFSPACVKAWDVSFLSVLTLLEHVDVRAEKPTPVQTLVAELGKLKLLKHLSLSHRDLTSLHLTELLPRLRFLASLHLGLAGRPKTSQGITSLGFLKAPGLAKTLTQLRLTDLRALPASEAEALFTLRALSTLHLKDCFAAPLPADVLAKLDPRAKEFDRNVFPAMEKFEYTSWTQ